MDEKFCTEVQYLVFGNEEVFRDGLTKKGTSTIQRSIEEECYINENGKYKEEYTYITKEKAIEVILDPNQPHRIRDKDHNGMTLNDFINHPIAIEAKLTEAEVAVCRLYTGSLYIPWNYALRYYEDDPTYFHSWQTCISVLYNAVLKLSYLSKKGTVYRGINESKLKLNEKFWKPNGDEFSGGVEYGFMSTSLHESIAIEYARKGNNSEFSKGNNSECSIFVIQFDMASRGASLQWLSQYPYENELLYNPATCLTTEKFEIKNDIKYIHVRASVCTARLDVTNILSVKDKLFINTSLTPTASCLDDISTTKTSSMISDNNNSSDGDAIFNAATKGDIDELKKLLEQSREKINSNNEDGFSPLSIACYNGKLESVSVLIDFGADINQIDKFGNSKYSSSVFYHHYYYYIHYYSTLLHCCMAFSFKNS